MASQRRGNSSIFTVPTANHSIFTKASIIAFLFCHGLIVHVAGFSGKPVLQILHHLSTDEVGPALLEDAVQEDHEHEQQQQQQQQQRQQQQQQQEQQPQAGASWQGKNGDLLRTGASLHKAPAALSNGPNWTWTDPSGGVVRATPLIDSENNIYQASIAGSIYKFESTGKQLWNFSAGRSIPSVPAILDGLLFAATDDCTALAINATSGKALWRSKGGAGQGSDSSSITAGDGIVVVPCFREGEQQQFGGNTFLVAFDAHTGKKLWTYRPGQMIYNLVAAVVNESLVFEDQMGTVYRIKASDGSLLWKAAGRERAVATTGGAIVSNTGIVFSTSNVISESGDRKEGSLSAYRLADGHNLWRTKFEYPANSGPAVGHLAGDPTGELSVVVLVGTNPSLPMPHGTSIDMDRINPKELFRIETAKNETAKPAKAFAVNAATGKVRWSFDFPTWHGPAAGDKAGDACLPDSYANPAIDGAGTVFAVGETGRVYALSDRNSDGKISGADEVVWFDTKHGFQASPGIGLGVLAIAPCNGLEVFLQ